MIEGDDSVSANGFSDIRVAVEFDLGSLEGSVTSALLKGTFRHFSSGGDRGLRVDSYVGDGMIELAAALPGRQLELRVRRDQPTLRSGGPRG